MRNGGGGLNSIQYTSPFLLLGRERSIYDGYKNWHTNEDFPGMIANYEPMSNLMIPRCVAPSIDLITACSCVYRCGFMLIPSGPMFSFEVEKTYATCHQRSTMVCAISIYTISSNLKVFFSIRTVGSYLRAYVQRRYCHGP